MIAALGELAKLVDNFCFALLRDPSISAFAYKIRFVTHCNSVRMHYMVYGGIRLIFCVETLFQFVID